MMENKTPKRIAIFAAYNAGGKVSDYVFTYLKYLKNVAQEIIYVADNELSEEEAFKVELYAKHIFAKFHGEYDFGSYKRGIEYAKNNLNLENYDELILCHDSCYAMYSFDSAFDKMSGEECDLWGMTKNYEIKPHLQSYFLVFKKNVFLNPNFYEYFAKVKKLDDYHQIVETYEVPLLTYLESFGFKGGAVFELGIQTDPTLLPIKCLQVGVPFIKRKQFNSEFIIKHSSSLFNLISYLKYNYPNGYKEILKDIGEKAEKVIFKACWDNNPFLRFLYQKNISKRGLVRYRIFRIPVFMYFSKNDKKE